MGSGIYAPVLTVLKRRARKAWDAANDLETNQRRVLASLIDQAKNTRFGQDHKFDAISSYEEFRDAVQVRDYNQMVDDYWYRIHEGEPNVSWPGKTPYMIMGGGTTQGVKYTPLTHDGVKSHKYNASTAFSFLVSHLNSVGMMKGKSLILAEYNGVDYDPKGGFGVTRIGGLIPSQYPKWFEKLFMSPGYEVNQIENQDEKHEVMAKLCVEQDVRYIAAPPCWLIPLFEKIARNTGMGPEDKITEKIWPNLMGTTHTGMNFNPYRPQYKQWLGDKVAIQETYAATEGFFAPQDLFEDEIDYGLLLLVNHGYFHEFIALEDLDKPNPKRVPVWEVEKDKVYAMVISTLNGKFAYLLGDTLRFTELFPHRVRVAGRTALYLSIVGEHLMTENVDDAIGDATSEVGSGVGEYTVGPLPALDREKVHGHEWIIELKDQSFPRQSFLDSLDRHLRKRNADYDMFREVNGLAAPIAHWVEPGVFREWHKSRGQDHGQAKVPRLRPDRQVVDQVLEVVKRMNAEL